MDPIADFLSMNFAIFCLAIFTVTFIAKTIVEYYVKNVKNLDWWENIAFMIFPILLGGLGGFLIKTYPYPIGFASTVSHIIFGLVAGMLANTVGKVIISALRIRGGGAQTLDIVSQSSPPVLSIPQTTDETIPTNLPPRGQ